MIIIISAMTRDRVIGNHNGDGMPWHVPEEYQKFLDFIDGQAVIMGRKSFDIFQGDLSNCDVFVISRSERDYENATVCGTIGEAVEQANATGKDVYISGGAMIYELGIPFADKMYLSTIKGEFEGSTFFPSFDETQWIVTEHEDHERFEFYVYERSAL